MSNQQSLSPPTDILLDFIEERHHRLTVFEIFLFTMKENKH